MNQDIVYILLGEISLHIQDDINVSLSVEGKMSRQVVYEDLCV